MGTPFIKIYMFALTNINDEVFAVDYEPDTGNITFDKVYPQGTQIDIDFYTDGYFYNNLNLKEQSIIRFCVALMWYNRFKNDALNMLPKIQDSAFKTGSEHANINANTKRYQEMLTELADMMNDYAKSVAHEKIVAKRGLKHG